MFYMKNNNRMLKVDKENGIIIINVKNPMDESNLI
jgi:hypothetical protein